MGSSYLLDTHTLIWFLSGSNEISDQVKSIITKTSNKCFISIATLWEIAIKINLGKLDLIFPLKELGTVLGNNMIEILPVTFEHILELSNLENIHRDPFDRIIISQSKAESLIILSKDNEFHKYSMVNVIW